MSVYDLKPMFQQILRPLSSGLAVRGVTPNAVTIMALVLSAAQGALFALFPGAVWPLVTLPIVLFVRMALNAIDGMIAREYNQQSVTGKFLNEVGDVVSDLVLYVPFLMLFDQILLIWVFALFIIGMVASEVTGILSEVVSGVRRYEGPMGKSDRALMMGVFGLVLALLPGDEVLPTLLAFGLCVGVWATTYRRYKLCVTNLAKGECT